MKCEILTLVCSEIYEPNEFLMNQCLSPYINLPLIYTNRSTGNQIFLKLASSTNLVGYLTCKIPLFKIGCTASVLRKIAVLSHEILLAKIEE